MSTTDGAVFDMAVTVFNDATEGENYSNMHCVDTKVTVSLGCVRVVFLNKFVTKLLVSAVSGLGSL